MSDYIWYIDVDVITYPCQIIKAWFILVCPGSPQLFSYLGFRELERSKPITWLNGLRANMWIWRRTFIYTFCIRHMIENIPWGILFWCQGQYFHIICIFFYRRRIITKLYQRPGPGWLLEGNLIHQMPDQNGRYIPTAVTNAFLQKF